MKRNVRSPTQAGGFTLVELLVGLVVGLLIVAAASSLLAMQLRSQRHLALEHRLMQDLRAASDLVARDLRRAGYWGGAASAPTANPYAAMTAASSSTDAIEYAYSRDADETGVVDTNERFGVRLREGVVELLLGSGWQALTDAGTMTVTALRIVPSVHEPVLEDHCADCLAPGCRLRQQWRSVDVTMTARSKADAAIVRNLRSEVRVRNDHVWNECAS